jgi:hypothetical protein
MSVMVVELQEQLLVLERELDSRENALMAQEYDLAATKCALERARMECDAESNRVDAVQWDYRATMCASNTGYQHSLDFDQVFRGHQLILTMQETDLEQWEEKLDEEQAWGLYSFDGWGDLSVELEDLRERLVWVENERAAEDVQL